MHRLWIFVPVLLLASCAALGGGSSTTDRPALTRPPIEPDGAFWDAAVVSERGDVDAFLFLLSPQMLHRSLFPKALYPKLELRPVATQEEFDRQREEINERLIPHQSVLQNLGRSYSALFASLLRDRFIEVSKPTYSIKYKDSYSRAQGPNTARVVVKVYPKTTLPKDFEPEVMEIKFIQDGRRWLIDEIVNDPLEGAFTR